jgi:hypothetical protein
MWKTRGWRKLKGGRLVNADIWSQVYEALLTHGNVAWRWVPRRSDAMSKRVDRIAVAMRKSVQSSQATYDVSGGADHAAQLYGTRDGARRRGGRLAVASAPPAEARRVVRYRLWAQPLRDAHC